MPDRRPARFLASTLTVFAICASGLAIADAPQAPRPTAPGVVGAEPGDAAVQPASPRAVQPPRAAKPSVPQRPPRPRHDVRPPLPPKPVPLHDLRRPRADTRR